MCKAIRLPLRQGVPSPSSGTASGQGATTSANPATTASGTGVVVARADSTIPSAPSASLGATGLVPLPTLERIPIASMGSTEANFHRLSLELEAADRRASCKDLSDLDLAWFTPDFKARVDSGEIPLSSVLDIARANRRLNEESRESGGARKKVRVGSEEGFKDTVEEL